MQLDGFDLHRGDFAALFSNVKQANANLHSYASNFARKVLGDQFVDNKTGWLGWDVAPVYDGGLLIGVDFTSVIEDDRGPDLRRTERVLFKDPNGPLTADQRRALFAAFDEVFASRESTGRYVFTRMVLGKSAETPVSWSEHKPGRLTYGEASKVLDALALLEAAL